MTRSFRWQHVSPMAALATLAMALASGFALSASAGIEDVSGRVLRPFVVQGRAKVLFFLSSECPISRFYAPEIQRICRGYGRHGVSCTLLFEDSHIDPVDLRTHLDQFGYRDTPAAIDVNGAIARRTRATVTPQAIVLDRRAVARYRGRIDNFYADLGKPRRQATVHDLRDALDAVLADRPVSNPETPAVGCYIPK